MHAVCYSDNGVIGTVGKKENLAQNWIKIKLAFRKKARKQTIGELRHRQVCV